MKSNEGLFWNLQSLLLTFSSLNSTCTYLDCISYEVIIMFIIITITRFFTSVELLVYSNVFKTPISKRVWLIVAGRVSRVQSRGRGSNVAVAGSMSRSRVQSRGRGSNVAAGENDLGFKVTEWKWLIWTQYEGKKSFLCTILYGSQFTGYGC